MPDLDGGSAAALIRQSPGKSKPPAVIFVTAFGRDEIMGLQADGEMPYAELLTKPVTPQQIIEALKRALALKTNPKATSVHSRLEPLLGITLLVVEDNAFNRQVASELLEGEGATVYLAEGGLEGVDMVLNGDQQFDLVIMDIQMPDIDGMEATKRIRADARFKKLPILAMTANASSADREACLASSMNDHIGKPIDIVEVVARIHSLVGEKDISHNKQQHKTDSIVAQSEIEIFSAILSRFAGKADLYERMLINFKLDVTKLLATVKEETVQQNPTKVAVALHSVKGVASTMGAKALASKAAELEKKFKSPDTPISEKIVSKESLDELYRILDVSVLRLTEQLNVHKGKTLASPQFVPTLTPEEWKLKLIEVLPKLEADNMSAISMLEKLSASSRVKEQQKMEELLVQVNALDFVTAIVTLKRLLLEF
jgi:CheY-like chemotaxis protein/HPt (histidine-containing phosphotransfer) domain-containing protein